MVVPAANVDDVILEDEYRDQVRIVPVSHIGEVLEVALESSPVRASLVERLKRLTGGNLGVGNDRGSTTVG